MPLLPGTASTGEMSIVLQDLSVRLGKKWVLKHLDCTLCTDGKVTGLFGPNGAGKTTLLRTIVGLIGRYEGRLRVNHPEGIAYLPDSPYLYAFLRLRDCIQLFAARHADFNVEKAERIFEDLELALEQRISECSRGMREQIHIGLTMARDARLYVFDEPLATVDPLTRDKLVRLILERRAGDSGVLISTHLIAQAEELFDEVVMINEGEIVLHEAVADLRRESGLSLEDVFKKRMVSS